MAQKKVKLRHSKILNELKKKGSVELKDLADQFGYHEMTIRRDLKKLEEMGFLVRTLGGATIVPARFLGHSSDMEQETNWSLKQAIVEYASRELVEDGDSIFLSSGVTMLQLLKQLHKEHIDLHIYTNGIDILSFEYANLKYKLTTTGGHLRPDAPCLYGDLAKEDLKSLKGKINKVFLEVDAVVAEEDYKGFMTYNNFEASVYPLILKLTEPENIYILADSSKFEKLGVFEVAKFEQINSVITNKLKDKLAAQFKDIKNIVQIGDK